LHNTHLFSSVIKQSKYQTTNSTLAKLIRPTDYSVSFYGVKHALQSNLHVAGHS